jgi:SAM-dependent methyltransferase
LLRRAAGAIDGRRVVTAAWPTRDCPICGGAERRVLFHQEFAAVDHATPVTGYDVVVCGRCGGSYADGIPDQLAFDRYYRDMSRYEYAQRAGAESEYDRRRLALIADIIAPHLESPDVRILDVGCASGRLLANLRDRGFANGTGLDPSPACAAAAARLYSIDVRTMTLAEIARAGERFDAVVMVGVLEHLRDLDDAFGQLRALLSARGLLYVEVPDVTAFADWPNAPYQDFSTEHINFFSPISLSNLMGRYGFAPVYVEQNHREQSYKTVMSNLSGMYRLEPELHRGQVQLDLETARGLERYLAQCAADDERLRARIDDVVDGRRPILVWGVGTHTTRLMATSRLAEADIVAFIESNSRYHGKTLHGRPILPPGALKDHDEPVLISSRVFEREIAEQIRHDLGCSNQLILLYHV